MKKIFVEQIRERDWVDSPFLVRDKIMAMAKNGKPYMTLKLMDRTGEVEGRVWDRVDEFCRPFRARTISSAFRARPASIWERCSW